MCIVDTGVDWQHPDLVANLWMNEKEVNGPGATAANGYQNGIDDDNDGEHPHCIVYSGASRTELLSPLCEDEAATCKAPGPVSVQQCSPSCITRQSVWHGMLRSRIHLTLSRGL